MGKTHQIWLWLNSGKQLEKILPCYGRLISPTCWMALIGHNLHRFSVWSDTGCQNVHDAQILKYYNLTSWGARKTEKFLLETLSFRELYIVRNVKMPPQHFARPPHNFLSLMNSGVMFTAILGRLTFLLLMCKKISAELTFWIWLGHALPGTRAGWWCDDRWQPERGVV